jgi:PKHD-type hydroxylase
MIIKPPFPLTFCRGDGPDEGAHLGWLSSIVHLDDAVCDQIINVCGAFPLSPPSTVGEDLHPGHRCADVRNIRYTEQTSHIYDLLCRVAETANRSATQLVLTGITREPQYLEYRQGWGHFDWHNDYSHGLETSPRKLTIILQLSNPSDYEGGRLEAFGASLTQLPVNRGSILVFPSIIPHRVTPVSSGIRRALVSWISGPRMK